MTDPAATLRAASDKLRGLTAAADHDVNTNPYWRSDLTDRPDWYANGTRNALGCPAGDLAAALTPAACADLADWLDDASRDAVEIGPDPHALTLAAHLLGEQLADAPSNSPTAGGSSRLFSLHRDRDISGVSGTGIVADGCAWPDGTVSIRWRGTTPSTVSWNSIADAEHVHGHGGATRIVWATGTPASTTTEDGPRCACGDPIEWMAHPDGSGWIHSPGSDTPCLDARPADRPAECGPECAEGHLYAYRCALKPPPVDPAAILGAAQQPSTIWIDGDPLMEAIAAAVWEQCNTEPGSSVVDDDPRNIAAVAAAVARKILGATDESTAEHHVVDGVRYLCHADDHYCPDEAQQPTPAVIEAQAEAYPTETSWIAEVQESGDQWMYLRADCDRAVVEQRIASMQKRFPQWKDGTPVNSRIIRKTTTYTVDAAPAVTEEPTR